MRYITALALPLLLPVLAFAYSPKQPEHHKRYSPNSEYFVDFNPETNVHTIYATKRPNEAIWSVETDAFWPYKHDESDGCLFVADDGSSFAGPTWVPWEGKPPDYRMFDGLEFLDSLGGTIDHIGAQFCQATYPTAFILVPVTLVISAAGLMSSPRRFDMLGPWLAIMSVAVLVAVLNPY